jgi:hydroxypyruvate reductase
MSHSIAGQSRALLTELYWAGVRAVTPGPALCAALERVRGERRGERVWIIAVGKAAGAMSSAAVEMLRSWREEPAGGIIVAPSEMPSPHAAIDCVTGEHPIPGARSHEAARRIGEIASRVPPGDEAWVLISGGTTSLTAAPVEGVITPEELVSLYELLLGSGLNIAEMNLIRKRFSRWGAGRLARALSPARVRAFIISDVNADDLAAIGSGPCTPDPSTAGEIRTILDRAQLWDHVPPGVRQHLRDVELGRSLETPNAEDEAFRRVEQRIIASNRVALDAIAARALELGFAPRIVDASLSGEAATAGAHIAETLATYHAASAAALSGSTVPPCLIWGGETTVTLGANTTGVGGRCTELALSAARVLARRSGERGAALLAAGTDGRDGPTDAAGAIVDHTTWSMIQHSGRDPERDLAEHDSYSALEAACALLYTGLTGTNVMDVVIGVP